jgi:hypothetical protein
MIEKEGRDEIMTKTIPDTYDFFSIVIDRLSDYLFTFIEKIFQFYFY